MDTYVLHDLAPHTVAAPGSAEELAATLRAASHEGLAVVPWGYGTRQHLAAAPSRYDLALSTRSLSRIVAYEPADLVLTVEAGATLGAVQAELAAHGQWLPWDPPLPARASIGGLLASGAAGPLRLGFGHPRDWTLGMRVALGDGRLVKSGGRVVKNVAGYDTHKLQIGAFGTLGVILEATFKVQPLPEHRRTLLASYTEQHLPEQAIEQLRAAPLQPIAMAALNSAAGRATPALHTFLEGQPAHFVVAAHYVGTAAAVGRQIREAARRCLEVGAHTIELRDGDDGPLWAAIADLTAPRGDGSLLLRAAAPSGAFTPLAALVERTARRQGWRPAQLVLAGPGLLYSRWPAAEPAAWGSALAEVRAGVAALGGYAVVEEAPPAAGLDRWGPAPEGAALMRALRAAWDPAGVLNPGRYVV